MAPGIGLGDGKEGEEDEGKICCNSFHIYIVFIGVNLSYMLSTSIRTISVGYGLESMCMLKEGWKLSIIVIVLMTALSYVLLKYWPAFSTI